MSEPVTVLSSLAEPANHPFQDWIPLPGDNLADGASDPTADGLLHWAPLHDQGLQARMSLVSQWISRWQPLVMVVDVSVEVTLLARLCGVPVVAFTGPGTRSDRPHDLAYQAATAIVACWPSAVYDPPFLLPFKAKTHYVGALSRFDTSEGVVPAEGDRVVVLNGAGGSTITQRQVEVAAAATGTTWATLGVADADWHEDVWRELKAAAVVVTHAGQNALAEVAAARRPAVIVPQDRPFGEQHEIANALAAQDIAVSVAEWPDAGDWPELIKRARALGGGQWSRWSSGDGAVRVANVIESVGKGLSCKPA